MDNGSHCQCRVYRRFGVDDALSSHYTWDPNSLAGTSQNTYTKAACGFSAGTTTTSNIQFKAAEAAH